MVQKIFLFQKLYTICINMLQFSYFYTRV